MKVLVHRWFPVRALLYRNRSWRGCGLVRFWNMRGQLGVRVASFIVLVQSKEVSRG